MSPDSLASLPAAVCDASEASKMSTNSNSAIWRQFGVKAVAGDSVAIGKLLQVYRAAMTSIAQKRIPASVRQQVGASDIVQQTCSDVCGSIRNVKAGSGDQLWGWMVSLLLKNIVDTRRRLIACRKRTVLREVPGAAIEIGQNTLGTSELSALDQLIAKEDAGYLAVALDRIPEGYATVLRWYYHDNQTFVEIAARVDRTPDAVRMLVRRGEAALYKELQSMTSGQM